MFTQIINANIVLDNEILQNAVCRLQDGKITYVGKEIVPAENTIDAMGGYLLAGFIDIHCHGGDGYDFMDASVEEMKHIADFHLGNGTTSLVATTMTAPTEEIEQCLINYKECVSKYPESSLVGVHMEGPWFSPEECGAQPTAFFQKPDNSYIERLKKDYPFIVRVSVAPEVDQNFEFGKKCQELGLIVSAGHTGATFSDMEKAKECGYSLMTHLYSGMKGVFRKNAYRTAGAVEAGLYFDDLYVEIITDGKHLPKELLKFIYKCKGSDKTCLITDGTRACGYKDGMKSVTGSMKNGTECIVRDGVAFCMDGQGFSGSVATSDRLVRVMHFEAEIDLCEVSKMISKTPAKVMGLTDRGEIKEGYRADLVIMDKQLNVKNVILNGKIIK